MVLHGASIRKILEVLAGFEPATPQGHGFADRRINHSAIAPDVHICAQCSLLDHFTADHFVATQADVVDHGVKIIAGHAQVRKLFSCQTQELGYWAVLWTCFPESNVLVQIVISQMLACVDTLRKTHVVSRHDNNDSMETNERSACFAQKKKIVSPISNKTSDTIWLHCNKKLPFMSSQSTPTQVTIAACAYILRYYC